MKSLFSIFLFIAITFFAGCASSPPSPLHKESSAIAIHVGAYFNYRPLSLDCFRPEKVFFIKLNDDNSLLSTELVESTMNIEAWWGDNLIGRNTTYLFNIPPGRYAAVAAYGTGYIYPDNVIYLFSEEMIKSTIVEVKPGFMVYMGAFVSERGSMFSILEKSDDVQKFYYKHFSSIYKNHGGLLSGYLIPENYYYISTPLKEKHTGKEYKKKFLEKQFEEFKGTEWGIPVKNELEILQ